MDINYFFKVFTKNEFSLTEELSVVLSQEKFRRDLYKLLLTNENDVYRVLLLKLFKLEMQYRDDLWHGKENDSDDFYENIYCCAYLLNRIGNPTDVFILWEAKYLNMDVGTVLDANYFIGAGFDETIVFLELSKHKLSEQIQRYIVDSFDVEDNQKKWSEGIINMYF